MRNLFLPDMTYSPETGVPWSLEEDTYIADSVGRLKRVSE